MLYFQSYDYKKIFDNMLKPAFIFDGRMILDHSKLQETGFRVYTIGKNIARTQVNRATDLPMP